LSPCKVLVVRIEEIDGVQEGLSVRGWMCEGCKWLGEGPGTCQHCGGTISGAELVNELIELA
jgi:hypothetical protein